MILDNEAKKASGEILNSRPCVISGCEDPGVVVDSKNLTQRRGELGYGFGYDTLDVPLDKLDGRTVWYCNTHAKKYLFPVIDIITGNTVGQILEDFAFDDLM